MSLLKRRILISGKETDAFLRREWTLPSMTGAKNKADAAGGQKTLFKRDQAWLVYCQSCLFSGFPAMLLVTFGFPFQPSFDYSGTTEFVWP